MLLNNRFNGTGSIEELLELSPVKDALLREGESETRTGEVKQKTKLCIPSLRGFLVVDISSIVYCEASSNYTNLHFANSTSVCVPKTIYEYEELLKDCNFIRIHRSFMVNPDHIKEYIRGEGGYLILSNNHEVEVSRRKKDILISTMKKKFKW